MSGALKNYKYSLLLKPNNPEVRYGLALLYEDKKPSGLEKAKKQYRYIASQKPDTIVHLKAINNLARLEILEGNYEGIAQDLHRGLNAIEEIKSTTDSKEWTTTKYALLKNLGWVRSKQPGREPDAEAHFRDAIALLPERSLAHCLLAETLTIRQQRQKALFSWENC